MAKQTINIGTTANDGTGDPLRTAFDKVNSNFTELYNDDTGDVNSIIAGDGISVDTATGDVTITNTITNNNQLTNGAGYVDGTGTANYIAKWTDGDTIGNSVIYDNGTNVGIGTSSPTTNLDIQGGGAPVIRIGNTGGVNGYQLKSNVSSSADFGFIIEDYSSVDLYKIQAGSSGSHHFYIDGSEKMRIDSDGNVGIGTATPSSTLEIAKNDQTNGATLSITNSFDGIDWTENDIIGSIDFKITDGSTPQKVRGQIKVIHDSNSGTYPFANAMTFSTAYIGGLNERMRIDSSGNVGIGTSSPFSKLSVQNGNITTYRAATNSEALFIAANNTYNWSMGIGSGDYFAISGGGGLDVSGAERMRIDSSGRVGIGGTPTGKFEVFGSGGDWRIEPAGVRMTFDNASGGYIRTEQAVPLVFETNGSNERMRIDSSGNVGIGTSSPTQLLHLRSAAPAIEFDDSGFSTVRGRISSNEGSLTLEADYNNTRGSSIIAFNVDSAERMRLQSNGDLHVDGDVIAYSTTISDQRLKDDIQTIDNALDKVSNLRGVSYTWNNGNRKGQKDLGLIAQEVEQVLPELVREKEMPMIDGGTYKTVDYEKIVGVLIEAVKELTDKVNKLEAK